MSKISIEIQATPSDDVVAWWIAIDDQDLTFDSSGSCIAMVDANAEHLLYIWFKGNPGANLKFEILQVDDQRLKGRETIPPGYFKVGVTRIFKTA